MILTPEQKAAALSGGNVDAPIGRGSIRNKRWPGGVVVYTIDGSLCKNKICILNCNFFLQLNI